MININEMMDHPNQIWFMLLCILGIVLLGIVLNKRFGKVSSGSNYHEGFSQDAPFMVKTDKDVYDDFYVELYDKINQPKKHGDFVVDRVISMTQPSKESSIFLDIGSGTGHLMNRLQEEGYKVYGIDYSQSMIKKALTTYPDLSIKQGDINVPMTYDRNTFSHILCTGMTIYQIQDKAEFFRNCYYWLKPNAFLILHLVDRDRFDTVVPGGRPPMLVSPQTYADNRITDTAIDFIDFQYKATYQFIPNDVSVYFKETMTDGLTNHVRQNEMTMYMENYNDILYMASRNGFIVHGQVNLLEVYGDQYQYIFVLERTL